MRVPRYQRFLEFKLQRFAFLLEARELVLTHLPNLFIVVFRHLVRGSDVVAQSLVLPEQSDDWFEARILPGQVAKPVLVANDFGIRHQSLDLLESIAGGLEFVKDRVFHALFVLFEPEEFANRLDKCLVRLFTGLPQANTRPVQDLL